MIRMINRMLQTRGCVWSSQRSSPILRMLTVVGCVVVSFAFPYLKPYSADNRFSEELEAHGLQPVNEDERLVITQIKMYRELLKVSEQTNAEFSRTRDCYAAATLALDGFTRMIENGEYRGVLLKEFDLGNVDEAILMQLQAVAVQANYPRGDAGRISFCGRDERLLLVARHFAQHSGMWGAALGTRRG